MYPSFGFTLNLLSVLSLSLFLLLCILLITLIRCIAAWWRAITPPDLEHQDPRVSLCPALGEAIPEPSLGPGPSRAITKAEAPALVEETHLKELLFDVRIQKRIVLTEKKSITTQTDYLLW
jgi:hypothetical protein